MHIENNEQNDNSKFSPIGNNFKCKLIKLPNQNTHISAEWIKK
jgi:hypothetical protein